MIAARGRGCSYTVGNRVHNTTGAFPMNEGTVPTQRTKKEENKQATKKLENFGGHL